MVYISSSGQISESREWSLSRIANIFWSLLNLIVLFFRTLLNPGLTKKGNGYESSYRPGSGGRGPPPPPPRRRMGGFHGGVGGVGPPPAPMGG